MSNFSVAEFDALRLADFQTRSEAALRCCLLSLRNKSTGGESVMDKTQPGLKW